MKHWWVWVLVFLFLSGGTSSLTNTTSGLLSGSTGLLLIIGLVWYFSRHHHAG